MISERPPTEQAPAATLLRELREYLDPNQCGAFLCICAEPDKCGAVLCACNTPDGDPCPLCAFVRRMDAALASPWRVHTCEGPEALEDALNACEREGYVVHSIIARNTIAPFVVVARAGDAR